MLGELWVMCMLLHVDVVLGRIGDVEGRGRNLFHDFVVNQRWTGPGLWGIMDLRMRRFTICDA